jgi:hypothetical protein
MPNWTSNKLTAPKAVIDSIINEGTVDFNLIIPMPASIDIGTFSNSAQQEAWRILGIDDLFTGKPAIAQDGISEEDLGQAEQMAANHREYGALNWCEWAPRNWGTKWNASQCDRISDTELAFDTAWSMPYPVMKELAEQSGESITVDWTNEDDYRLVRHKLVIHADGTEKYTTDDPSERIKLGETYYGVVRPAGADKYKVIWVTTELETATGGFLVSTENREIKVMDREGIAIWYDFEDGSKAEASAAELNPSEPELEDIPF